jgi:hypothetical protein
VGFVGVIFCEVWVSFCLRRGFPSKTAEQSAKFFQNSLFFRFFSRFKLFQFPANACILWFQMQRHNVLGIPRLETIQATFHPPGELLEIDQYSNKLVNLNFLAPFVATQPDSCKRENDFLAHFF